MRNTHFNIRALEARSLWGRAHARALLVALLTTGSAAHAADFYFDPQLIQGSPYGQGIDFTRMNQQEDRLPAGDYLLDIYINGKYLRSKAPVTVKVPAGRMAEPCLSEALIKEAGIRVKPLPEGSSSCRFIGDLSQKLTWKVNSGQLRLDITLPQSELNRQPRGYIPPSQWDKGTTAAYVRHNTNYYYNNNTKSDYRYHYAWSNIDAGANIGAWQVRHQGNARFSDSNTSGSDYKYNSSRTWVQRPVAEIEGIVAVGENYTNSSQFGTLSFNGLKVSTDQRMRPQSRRGYAPEVRGIATTTARVIVSQQGKAFYETTVPPGPFIIDDLGNSGYRGDLEVKVIEADGHTSSFTVPYTAVPDSVRAGNWNYELSMGNVRRYSDVDNKFAEGVVQYGVNNALTANLGSRIGEDYQAALVGGVLTTRLGAFGVNTTYSHADMGKGQTESGWRVEASYAKVFATRTNLSLAAYRYSTSGFRDLEDVLGVRRQNKSGDHYYSDTLYQRNSFSAAISQPMDEWGNLSFSGSTSDYYGNSGRISQFQMSYSNSWNSISYNLSAGRQRTVYTDRFNSSVNDDDFNSHNKRKYTENTFSLGVSIPLDFAKSRSQLSTGYYQSKTTKSANVGMSGTVGEDNRLSYSTYVGTEHVKHSGTSGTAGVSLEQKTAVGALRGSASAGRDYHQLGAGVAGTVVLHSGGVTAGPWTSDTFALVEAKGAQGAKVNNGMGAEIDRFGYAILPSVTPYQFNNISLNSSNMNHMAELQGGSQQVVPYAGAIAKVSFSTITGHAALITTRLADGSVPPMGAAVTDSTGAELGMVGQAGQLYARLPEQSGVLFVEWGTSASQRCRVNYQLSGEPEHGLYNFAETCRQGGAE